MHTHTHAHTCVQARAHSRASRREQAHAQSRAHKHTHHRGSEQKSQTRCQRAAAVSGSSAVSRLAVDFFNPLPVTQWISLIHRRYYRETGRALARSIVSQARQRSWLASGSSASAGASWPAGPEGLQGGEAEGGGGLPRERTHAHTRTLALTHARTHVGGRERLPTRSRADARTLTAAGP